MRRSSSGQRSTSLGNSGHFTKKGGIDMPKGDKNGPPWRSGPGTKRGGMGGRRGSMGGTKLGSGPGGECVCPSCGTTAPHEIEKPCYQQKCPKCGAAMVKK